MIKVLRGPNKKEKEKIDQELVELGSGGVGIGLLTWLCTTEN